MKKVKLIKIVAVVTISLLTMNVTANAQEKGDIAVAENGVLGLGKLFERGGNFTNFGIGAKLQYNLIKTLRLEGTFNYFLEKDFFTMWDWGLNAHYLFFAGEKLVFYPLAGAGILGIQGEGVSDSGSYTEFGVNFGAGFDIKLTENTFLNFETKYRTGEVYKRFNISAGIGLRF
jgi:outer membrane protein X